MTKELSYYKSLIPAIVEQQPVTLRMVGLLEIDREGSLQPRQGTNPETIEDYADRMRGGVEFHPIVLALIPGRTRLVVIDGHHRLAALHRLDRARTLALVVDLATEALYRRAVLQANTDGKRPLTSSDHEVRLALAHQDPELAALPTRELARLLGGVPSHNTIAEWRRHALEGLPRPVAKKRGRPAKDPNAQPPRAAGLVIDARGLPDLGPLGRDRARPLGLETKRIMRVLAEEDAGRRANDSDEAVRLAAIERLTAEGLCVTDQHLRAAAAAQLERAVRMWKLLVPIGPDPSQP